MAMAESPSGYIDCGEYITAGGSGTVYIGKWREETLHASVSVDLLPKVVMKVIHIPSLTGDEEKNKRFKKMKRELELWRSMRHDRILPLVGIARVDNDANRPALVSPWMQHGNISEFLKRNPKFRALRFLQDIIEGVHYLHNFDPEIVHGDIKAANILVTDRMEACLCDFGLSRFAVDNTLWRTTATHASGTLRWMAPELFEGDAEVPTKASDMYAYAMTCYEILTRNMPFKSISNDVAVMRKVLEGKRPEYVAACDPEVWIIITQCWAQEPNDRPEAGEVLAFIQNITKEPTSESLNDNRNNAPLRSFPNALFPVRGYKLVQGNYTKMVRKIKNVIQKIPPSDPPSISGSGGSGDDGQLFSSADAVIMADAFRKAYDDIARDLTEEGGDIQNTRRGVKVISDSDYVPDHGQNSIGRQPAPGIPVQDIVSSVTESGLISPEELALLADAYRTG